MWNQLILNRKTVKSKVVYSNNRFVRLFYNHITIPEFEYFGAPDHFRYREKHTEKYKSHNFPMGKVKNTKHKLVTIRCELEMLLNYVLANISFLIDPTMASKRKVRPHYYGNVFVSQVIALFGKYAFINYTCSRQTMCGTPDALVPHRSKSISQL